MYLPKYFEAKNFEQCAELISRFPLATVITLKNGTPCISHLPLLLQTDESGAMKLIGHLANRNPQLADLQEEPITTALFHGPQAYVRPTWYTGDDVPSWNYTTVHITGKAKVLSSHADTVEALKILSEKMEGSFKDPWPFYLPEDLAEEGVLTSAITAFEISVSSLQGKFKLAQNRSVADRQGVIAGLRKQGDDASLQIAELMAATI
ncbi:Protease synthase and sporulation protein PAI 2 [compost metagenome]